jgi:hypothetical protein
MTNFLNPRAVNAQREAAAFGPAAPSPAPAAGGVRFAKPFTPADRERQRKALAAKLREIAARDSEARQ